MWRQTGRGCTERRRPGPGDRGEKHLRVEARLVDDEDAGARVPGGEERTPGVLRPARRRDVEMNVRPAAARASTSSSARRSDRSGACAARVSVSPSFRGEVEEQGSSPRVSPPSARSARTPSCGVERRPAGSFRRTRNEPQPGEARLVHLLALPGFRDDRLDAAARDPVRQFAGRQSSVAGMTTTPSLKAASITSQRSGSLPMRRSRQPSPRRAPVRAACWRAGSSAPRVRRS